MLSPLEREELLAGLFITILALALFVSCYCMTGRNRTTSSKAPESK